MKTTLIFTLLLVIVMQLLFSTRIILTKEKFLNLQHVYEKAENFCGEKRVESFSYSSIMKHKVICGDGSTMVWGDS